jgi:hypothetical protein
MGRLGGRRGAMTLETGERRWGRAEPSRAWGSFRDGAPRWIARHAWVGSPASLSRALTHRGAGWLAGAAVSGLGVWLRLVWAPV